MLHQDGKNAFISTAQGSLYWGLLLCLLAVAAGCATGRPAEDIANTGEGLAAPSRLHTASESSGILTLLGKEYSLAIPHIRVAVDGNMAHFTPDTNDGEQDPAGMAYAAYEFDLDGYGGQQAIATRWSVSGLSNNAMLGVANWVSDDWDWYALPEVVAGKAEVSVPFADHIASDGRMLVVVQLTGRQPWRLCRMTIGGEGSGWTHTCNGITESSTAVKVAVDSAGNTYQICDSRENYNAVKIQIIKYSPAGNQLWRNALDFCGDTSLSDIAVDNQGRIYLTTITNTYGASNSITLFQLSSAGAILWQRRYPAADGLPVNTSLAVDEHGIYLCATFNMPRVINGWLGYVDGGGDYHDFRRDNGVVMKLDQNGLVQWHMNIDSGIAVSLYDVVPDGAGGCYCAGQLDGTGLDSNQNGVIVGRTDMPGKILALHASDGELDWFRTFEYGFETLAKAACVSWDGNIWLAGTLNSFGDRPEKGVVLCLAPDGRFEQAFCFDRPDTRLELTGISSTADGKLYVCGNCFASDNLNGFYAVLNQGTIETAQSITDDARGSAPEITGCAVTADGSLRLAGNGWTNLTTYQNDPLLAMTPVEGVLRSESKRLPQYTLTCVDAAFSIVGSTLYNFDRTLPDHWMAWISKPR